MSAEIFPIKIGKANITKQETALAVTNMILAGAVVMGLNEKVRQADMAASTPPVIAPLKDLAFDSDLPLQVRQKRLEGYEFYEFPILGQRDILVAAGVEGLRLRKHPFVSQNEDETLSYVDYGHCIGAEGSPLLTKNPDGSTDVFGRNPGGYFRLMRTEADGKAKWFVTINDSRCRDLPRYAGVK